MHNITVVTLYMFIYMYKYNQPQIQCSKSYILFNNFISLLILFLAVLGFHCCGCYSLIAACGLLIVWLLLLQSTGPRFPEIAACEPSSCSSKVLEHRL